MATRHAGAARPGASGRSRTAITKASQPWFATRCWRSYRPGRPSVPEVQAMAKLGDAADARDGVDAEDGREIRHGSDAGSVREQGAGEPTGRTGRGMVKRVLMVCTAGRGGMLSVIESY